VLKGNFSIDAIELECINELRIKISNIASDAEKYLDQLLDNPKIQTSEIKFNHYFNNLISFEQQVHLPQVEIKPILDKLEHKILNKITILTSKTEDGKVSVEDLGDCLIKMKSISNNIPSFKEKIDQTIDSVLSAYKQKYAGTNGIAKLETILSRDKCGVGQNLISEHKCFQGYALSLFNTKTQKHDIKSVFDEKTGLVETSGIISLSQTIIAFDMDADEGDKFTVSKDLCSLRKEINRKKEFVFYFFKSNRSLHSS